MSMLELALEAEGNTPKEMQLHLLIQRVGHFVPALVKGMAKYIGNDGISSVHINDMAQSQYNLKITNVYII